MNLLGGRNAMRKVVCISIALLLLLTACSAQTPEPDTGHTYGVYKFRLSVEQISGWPFGRWQFVYTYKGETITSGYRIRFPLDLFALHAIRVDIKERNAPDNVYTSTLLIGICDGGSGETEVTVTGRDGWTATFRITCNVTQVGSLAPMDRYSTMKPPAIWDILLRFRLAAKMSLQK